MKRLIELVFWSIVLLWGSAALAVVCVLNPGQGAVIVLTLLTAAALLLWTAYTGKRKQDVFNQRRH